MGDEVATLAVQVRNAERMMTQVSVGVGGLDVRFADGREGVIPFVDLGGIEGASAVERLDLPNPYEILIFPRRGEPLEVPWDFARHYCDPGFRARAESGAERGRRAIGIRIRELRVRSGKTQEALANAAGVGRVTLIRIEKGEQSPRYENLLAIARALGIEPGDLMLP